MPQGVRQEPIDVPGFVHEHAQKLVLHAIDAGEHLLITGPRGCGQSQLASWGAGQRSRPCEVFHFGGTTDAETTMQGFVSLRGGDTVFVRSRFVEAISKPGTVVLLDEINRAGTPKVEGTLLACMDDFARLVIDQESPDRRVVDVAPGVVFIATANLGAEYVGTGPLDAALLDRMLFLSLDYSPRERDLLIAHGLSAPEAQTTVKIAQAIRHQSAQGALTSGISSRGLVQIAGLLAAGFEIGQAFEAVVGVWDEETRAALRTILKVAR